MTQRPISINSNDNTVYCTSMCNNRCVMCCQPPQSYNDIDELYAENLIRIDQAPKELSFICITGGEPTLLGDKLVTLIQYIRDKLPQTDIMLLTNARKFANSDFAAKVSSVGGERLFVGTELHSDYANDHNMISGVQNAYQETILGIYNLASYGIDIELRVIVCKANYTRLYNIAQFVHKNLPFVYKIAFMGMECTGYAFDNYESVWIEPSEYNNSLKKAVLFLSSWKYDVNIYNVPLCLLPEEIRNFSRNSISDWKRTYPAKCNDCQKKSECCGLFSTSRIHYQNLIPFTGNFNNTISLLSLHSNKLLK